MEKPTRREMGITCGFCKRLRLVGGGDVAATAPASGPPHCSIFVAGCASEVRPTELARINEHTGYR